MNRLFFVTLLIFTTINHCWSQKMVIEEPKMLTDSINSAAEDIFPLLSPDGQTLYFVRTFYPQNMGGEKAGQDIWYSKRDAKGKWQAAHNPTTLNTINNNVVVGISSNEDTLYLLNTYSGPLRRNRGIAYALRTENSWDEPKELDLVYRNSGDFKAYYVTPDEKVIVMSTNGANSYGEEDIYVFLKEKGKWSKPIHLNETINTQGFEISPFLTEDKDTLFFASTGHPGQGDADIFMAIRLDSTWTNWSTPVNMGKEINSSGFDAYFSLSPTGEAFFSSNRNSKFSNIYTAHITFEPDSFPPLQDPDTMVVAVDTLPKKPVVEKTFYTVQILALKSREAPEKNFFSNLDLNLINMYVGKDGFNRFSIGQYDTLSLAGEAMKKLRTSGYPDAFVRKVDRYADLSVRQGEKVIDYYKAKEQDKSRLTSEPDSVPPPQEPETTVAAVDTLPRKTIVKETFYTVQILALKSREAPERNFFSNLDLGLINMYVGKDGFNRFSIGQYNTFSIAVDAMKKLRSEGYPDAFVRKIERYTELSVRQGEKVIDYYKVKEQDASRFH